MAAPAPHLTAPPAATATAIDVSNLSVRYRRNGAVSLSRVGLTIPDGQIVALIGTNGAGKSTLLRAASGVLPVRSGSIRFDGHDVTREPTVARLRRGIVHLPQARALFANMSVRDNVLLGGHLLDSRRELLSRYAEVVEAFPIVEQRAAEPAGNLSGGQRRLVEFARCLMMDPVLLMLDEPSVGLDPVALQMAFDSIEAMRDAGRSILLVEQNVAFASSLADTAVVMESGRVRSSGAAEEVLEGEQVVNLYFGGETPFARSGAGERA